MTLQQACTKKIETGTYVHIILFYLCIPLNARATGNSSEGIH
jgi:hypothetical protein